MVLPLLKLGTLFLRTLSKPLANVVKSRAQRHPKFRALIIGYTQRYHTWSTNFQRRIYGHETDVDVRPLNEERAVQAAADMVGEGVIFVVAGVLVVFEYGRSSLSDARKEESKRKELEDIRKRLESLEKYPEYISWQNSLIQKAGGVKSAAKPQQDVPLAKDVKGANG